MAFIVLEGGVPMAHAQILRLPSWPSRSCELSLPPARGGDAAANEEARLRFALRVTVMRDIEMNAPLLDRTLRHLGQGELRMEILNRVVDRVLRQPNLPVEFSRQHTGTIQGQQNVMLRMEDSSAYCQDENCRVLRVTLGSDRVSAQVSDTALEALNIRGFNLAHRTVAPATDTCLRYQIDSSNSPLIVSLQSHFSDPVPTGSDYCLCFIGQHPPGGEARYTPIFFEPNPLADRLAALSRQVDNQLVLRLTREAAESFNSAFVEALVHNVGLGPELQNLASGAPQAEPAGAPTPVGIASPTAGAEAQEATVRTNMDTCHAFEGELNDFRLPRVRTSDNPRPIYWQSQLDHGNVFVPQYDLSFFRTLLENPPYLVAFNRWAIRMGREDRAGLMRIFMSQFREGTYQHMLCGTSGSCSDGLSVIFRMVSRFGSVDAAGFGYAQGEVVSTETPLLGRLGSWFRSRLERCPIQYTFTSRESDTPTQVVCRGTRMILNLNQSGEWISRFVDSLVLDFCQVTPAAAGAPGGTTTSAATPAQAYSTILFHQVRSAAPEISLPVNHERLQSAVFGFSRYVAELFVRSVGIKIQSEPAFRDFITEADRAFAQDRELAQRNEAELLRVIERHFARQQAGEANPVPVPAPTPPRN